MSAQRRRQGKNLESLEQTIVFWLPEIRHLEVVTEDNISLHFLIIDLLVTNSTHRNGLLRHVRWHVSSCLSVP